MHETDLAASPVPPDTTRRLDPSRKPTNLYFHAPLGPQQWTWVDQHHFIRLEAVEAKLADDLDQNDLEFEHREDTSDALPRPVQEGCKSVRVQGLARPAVRVEAVYVVTKDARVQLDRLWHYHHRRTLGDA